MVGERMTESGFAREFLIAMFDDERQLVDAVRAVRSRGVRVYDVYTPYPVHRLNETLGLRRSRLPIVTLVGGVLGLIATLAFEFYAAVFDWRLNVGGKPDNSTLAFIPIAFEITVLGAGLATVGAFLVRCGLLPTTRAHVADVAATDDRFALVLRWRRTAFDHGQIERLLRHHGAREVVRKVLEL